MNYESDNQRNDSVVRRAQLFALILLALVAFGAATTGAQTKNKSAQPKSPRTVTDFYLLLPAKYFPFFDLVKNRRDLIEGENLKDGYLNFVGNRPGMPLHNEMLLLKRTSGVPLLVVSYNAFGEDQPTLRFLEYENGRWSEVDAAPPLDVRRVQTVYRQKTGADAGDNPPVIYELSPVDKSITVKLGLIGEEVEIYKLEWDGNVYDFALESEQ